MPIKIPDDLPARAVLENENIFIMDENRAYHQDIRPLRIVILNIMPTKITTETQLLRLLGNTPLQVEIVFIHPKTHRSKNTAEDHLETFYKTFEDIKDELFDGMIITGAPVEHLEFEDVTYWDELTAILDWKLTNVYSSLHICWGAQAALYHYYGIPKHPLSSKQFGIFPHTITKKNVKLLRGFDEQFYVPHSRHTENRISDVDRVKEIEILSQSEEAGLYICASKDGRQIFLTGHSEYDCDTLKNEYFRDVNKGLEIAIPKNYFPNDDVTLEPMVMWRSHAFLLFSNWLNYYVYQETPYDFINRQKSYINELANRNTSFTCSQL